MPEFEVKKNESININDLADLYNSVGWYTYTRDLNVLQRALGRSFYVLTVWSGEMLVGLLRAVGDGETILYIQDILVKPEFQRQGIGSLLMNTLISDFKNVRQKVLMTDNRPETISFYRKCGFVTPDQYHGTAFVKYEDSPA